MIEAGLAIIAACLPTLRFLVGKVSLDSMMNSVRSAFSLGSIRSQRSQISAARDGGPYSDLNGNGSRAQIVSNGGQTEISDLGSLETARAVGENIQVTQEISQYHSAV
ncbi:hypothetical protein MMC30_008765 [Trapelia coarctata]|nr:hypothetical protein [Trapelia coarctata]